MLACDEVGSFPSASAAAVSPEHACRWLLTAANGKFPSASAAAVSPEVVVVVTATPVVPGFRPPQRLQCLLSSRAQGPCAWSSRFRPPQRLQCLLSTGCKSWVGQVEEFPSASAAAVSPEGELRSF